MLAVFGLISLSIEALEDADERFGHAERHWREVNKPLHIHRILLQRSWVDTFRGNFAAAVERVAEARDLLDSWPRHSWLQYARLDDHLGSIRRAEALADSDNSAAKLEQAAELKVPAALAVDSVPARMSASLTRRSHTSSETGSSPAIARSGVKRVAAAVPATRTMIPSNSAVNMPLGSAAPLATEPNFMLCR